MVSVSPFNAGVDSFLQKWGTSADQLQVSHIPIILHLQRY